MYQLEAVIFSALPNQLTITLCKFSNNSYRYGFDIDINLYQNLGKVSLYNCTFIDFDIFNRITVDLGFCHGYLLRGCINKIVPTTSYDDCNQYCSRIEIRGCNVNTNVNNINRI